MYSIDNLQTVYLASNYGTPGGIRTPDKRFRKPLLYPTELLGHIECIKGASPYMNYVILLRAFLSSFRIAAFAKLISWKKVPIVMINPYPEVVRKWLFLMGNMDSCTFTS